MERSFDRERERALPRGILGVKTCPGPTSISLLTGRSTTPAVREADDAVEAAENACLWGGTGARCEATGPAVSFRMRAEEFALAIE